MCNCDLEILCYLIHGEIYTKALNPSIEHLYRNNEIPESFLVYRLNNGLISPLGILRRDLKVITNKNRDSYAEYLI